MEKSCYQEIISEVSKKLAKKISSEETNLAQRATLIDGDIAEIVQDIGLETTKKVLENTRDKIIEKKRRRINHSQKPDHNVQYGFWQNKDPLPLFVAQCVVLKACFG